MVGGTVGSFETADVEQIMKILNDASDQNRMAEAELDYCDKKTQDILHELELVEHTYHEQAKLSRELRDIRKRRRIAKEAIDLLAPILKWKDEQVASVNKLSKVIGDMRKIDEKRKNAVYYRRADDVGSMIR